MKLTNQIVRFAIIGSICFFIDYCILIFLVEIFEVGYLLSCAISFVISVIANYLLSIHFVFTNRRDVSTKQEFSLFFILSFVGLGLTELLMWLFVDILYINYMLSKIIVSGIVMIYNFVSKKMSMEKNE